MDQLGQVKTNFISISLYLSLFYFITESNDSPQIIKNITTIEDGEPTSSISALAVQLAAATVSESTPTPRERKKSITFNENVERIEIETEVPVTVNTYQF